MDKNQDMSYYNYVLALDRSRRELKNFVQEVKINPEIIDAKSHKILRDMYAQTKLALDKKKQETEKLTEVEEKFYEKCERELQKNELGLSLRQVGWLFVGKLIDAYESIYHILPSGKEEGRVQHALMEAGSKVLPEYMGFLSKMVDTYETLITSLPVLDILLGLSNMYDAASKAEKCYRVKNGEENKTMAEAMLRCSEYAYSGKSDDHDYLPMKASEIPENIRSMYHESNGIFSSGHGLRVWLAAKDNDIVVAFSGTDVSNIFMDYEDYIQIYSASQLYLEAAGLLKILLETFKTQQFYVCGHSLGGGLAQFSVTANIEDCSERVKCYAYNPAGLSSNSIKHLENERLFVAKDFVWVYVTCKDPVSVLGAKLGHVIKLPKTESNGHGILSLKACMDKYLSTPSNQITDNKIKLNLCIYDSKKLSYWKTAYIQSENREVKYTMFNDYDAFDGIPMSIELHENLIKAIISHDKDDCCFGIRQYVNGDAYTVFNRLSIFTDNASDIFFSREADASIVFFGTYGNGKKQWMRGLMNLLSDADSFVNKTNLDLYYSKVANEYDIMLEAWLHLLKHTYGYDFYAYFNRDVARNNAKLMLAEYAFENKTLYSKYNYERRLTKEEYKDYIRMKQNIFNNFSECAGQKVIEYHLMNEDELNFIKDNMKEYLNEYIGDLTK